MNLRRRQQAKSTVDEDNSNEVFQVEELNINQERVNHRISKIAKSLINFINEANKQCREARKKNERKQDQQINKAKPVKKQKIERPSAHIVHPPKPTTKVVQKHQINKRVQNPQYSRFMKEVPFSMQGNHRNIQLPPNLSYQLNRLPGQNIQLMKYLPNFNQLSLQNLQNFAAQISSLPDIQRMRFLSRQGCPPIISLEQMSLQQKQFLMGNNFIRVPPPPLQLPFTRKLKQFWNSQVGFQKTSYRLSSAHVGIAYMIHINKLESRPQAQQKNQYFINPINSSKKMREQNRGQISEVVNSIVKQPQSTSQQEQQQQEVQNIEMNQPQLQQKIKQTQQLQQINKQEPKFQNQQQQQQQLRKKQQYRTQQQEKQKQLSVFKEQ